MARTEVPKMKDEVAAAREMVARAEAAHARKAERLAEARREVERLTDELGGMDTDAPTFGQLVGERDAARGKVEALEEREQCAAGEVEQAKASLVDTEREQARARVEQIDAEIRRRDAALGREVLAFYEHMLGEVRELRKLTADANALGPHSDPARGSRWAAGPLHKGVFRWAVGALPDHVAGEEDSP
jgi:chromosome segregation ATPase